MQAYQLVEWQQAPELRDVDVPEPGPGEVLIKVGGAGACHSDLHVMEWPAGTLPYELPFTLGHENAGWIEAVGPGVTGWDLGAGVAVYGPWGCGRCRACRSTLETLCERRAEIGAAGGGLGRDGGMAEYMLVPDTRLLVPLGDLDPRDAAPLSDAALTPYHALKLALAKLVPGTSVLVIGVGGLGHMAVQLVRAISPADVIAVDVDRGKLELAREVGATATVEAGEDAAEAVRELTGGRGVTVVLDCVGTDATLALDAARRRDRRLGHGHRRRRRDAAADLRDDAVRRQHHPPVLGQRDRARGGPRARPHRPHPRARGALPARPRGQGLPTHARRHAQRPSRDHAQRLRSSGGGAGAQTSPPTASMCRRVNTRASSMWRRITAIAAVRSPAS